MLKYHICVFFTIIASIILFDRDLLPLEADSRLISINRFALLDDLKLTISIEYQNKKVISVDYGANGELLRKRCIIMWHQFKRYIFEFDMVRFSISRRFLYRHMRTNKTRKNKCLLIGNNRQEVTNETKVFILDRTGFFFSSKCIATLRFIFVPNIYMP